MMQLLGFYLTLAVAGWLTISALRDRFAGAGTRPFAAFGLIIGLWTVGELLLMQASSADERILARRAFFLAAATLPPAWFWVAVRAAQPRWFVRWPGLVGVSFLAPIFFYSCLYWDRSVRFVAWGTEQPTHGPWFDLFAAHQYAISLLATAYFAKTAIRLGRSSLPVMAALIVGVALPVIANVLYLAEVVQTDWTGVALAPTVMLLWMSVVESGLTSHVPIDRHDVIEQLDVGVIVADPDARIVSANAAAERLTETGGLVGRLLPEAVAAAEQRPDAYIETRGLALHGRFGIVGHALILHDRTDAEASRRRLELGGRLEALGSLTAGIAHEVNNPLAFIQANLHSLDTTAKALGGEEVRGVLTSANCESVDDLAALVEETQEGVERIRQLVERLGNFARTPDLAATALEVDLESSVRQAAAVAAIGQGEHAVEIIAEGELRVLSVETAIFQILVNLILNAVQASPDEPRVRIQISEQNEGVSIRVADSGPGIAEALLPRIFDPFFTTKTSGTGLGLALSYDLATQLGGVLEVSNREEGGALFELWLPRTPPEASAAGEAAMATPPVGQALPVA